MDALMRIIRGPYIMCIIGNHNWKALEKDVKTFQSVQNLTRVHERCPENPKGSLGVVSLCASYVSPLFYLDWVCSLFKKIKMTGREKELKYFRCNMKEFLTSNCSRILMYEGLSGYGKSQILMEIEYLSQGENHR